MKQTVGYAAYQQGEALAPFEFDRREVGDTDVAFDILFCGVCHSDLHQVNNDWQGGQYPMVPGHEVVGRVTAVGERVSKVSVGQLVGVGCFVDSCHQCQACDEGDEQYCQEGVTHTYNGEDKHLGGLTYGGYSKQMVVDESFILKMPTQLDPAASAPLLCAGITTYSPLKRVGVTKGSKVGVVGLGGLGHMAVKIAKAMGAEVTVISRNKTKMADADRLGADHYLAQDDTAALEAAQNKFDFILDTVSAKHDINGLLALLKRDATLTHVGLPHEQLELSVFPLVLKRININGSLVGGIPETQEMLDFCADHNITADIELIKMSEINEAYQRLQRSDVKYRFVIDIENWQ